MARSVIGYRHATNTILVCSNRRSTDFARYWQKLYTLRFPASGYTRKPSYTPAWSNLVRTSCLCPCVGVHTRLLHKGNDDVCRERIINFKTGRRNILPITRCREIAGT